MKKLFFFILAAMLAGCEKPKDTSLDMPLTVKTINTSMFKPGKCAYYVKDCDSTYAWIITDCRKYQIGDTI